MDTIGKKILHAFFGVIVGAGMGFAFVGRFSPVNVLYGVVGGAIIGGISAFYFTDTFWENLKDFF